MRHSRLIFVTGTDTGVGKTTLTALLLAHLRQSGVHALALKPFCSGSRADAELLRALQDGELSIQEISPFFFPQPLAPLAVSPRRKIPLRRVIAHIGKVTNKCDCLLVEGVGGLLVPLSANYFVLDLIRELDCEVLVVARNRLGTLNHTLLTMNAFSAGARKPSRAHRAKVVLMEPRAPDPSSASNPRLLRRLLKVTPVITLPYLGPRFNRPKRIRAAAEALRFLLTRLSLVGPKRLRV